MSDFEPIDFTSIDDIPGINAKALFSSELSKTEFRETGDISPVPIGDKHRYMPWGADDQLPYDILDLIERDETLSTCQMFNAEICYGSGLLYNTEACSEKVKEEIDSFFVGNNIPTNYLGVCQDFKYFAFCVNVIILNGDGSKIIRLIRKEACYCRLGVADSNGRIDKLYYANWRKAKPMEDQVEIIDLLDLNAPLCDLMVRMGSMPGDDGETRMRTDTRKFAVLTKVPTPDNTYYPIPYYASLFRGRWYNIKRLIGLAKEAKLKNSAPIKYHIEISDKYWTGIFRAEGITDRAKQQARVVEEKKKILEFLTGVENSGKAWFSQVYTNPNGDVVHDVVINKIETDKEGGDWASDIIEAVNMICFTMRVHSNLVGSVPGKAQTNNSGSDKRELYTIAQALQKPYHDLLFTVHNLVIRFNEWKGAYPDCPFIMLTTLDEKNDAKTVTVNTSEI